MTKRKSTGYYAAWIASNGRSGFPKPRKLYNLDEAWDITNDGWDRGGNDVAPLEEGFHPNDYGGFTYVSKSEDNVALVIESARQVFSGLLRSWGVSDE